MNGKHRRDEMKAAIFTRRLARQNFAHYQDITPLWKRQLHRSRGRRATDVSLAKVGGP